VDLVNFCCCFCCFGSGYSGAVADAKDASSQYNGLQADSTNKIHLKYLDLQDSSATTAVARGKGPKSVDGNNAGLKGI
jgi:hypothetical protein